VSREGTQENTKAQKVDQLEGKNESVPDTIKRIEGIGIEEEKLAH